MNIVFEAVAEDGTHHLISHTKIRSYMELAKLYDENRAWRAFGQGLAAMMAANKFAVLVEIVYYGDGSQKRTEIIRRVNSSKGRQAMRLNNFLT